MRNLGQVSRLTVDGSITMALGILQTGPDTAVNVGAALTLSHGACFKLGGGSTLEVAGSLSVWDSNTTLLVQSKNIAGQVDGRWQAAGATIHAADVVVSDGAALSADAQGYSGAHNASGLGPGAAGLVGGGSHGGAGVMGGPTYDSSLAPTQPGASGGGAYVGGWDSGTGGSGGGAVHLVVTNQLTLLGRISADAGLGAGGGSFGGGAGGALWIEAGTLSGGGRFSACGSAGDQSGGGGRIAVYYANASGFTGFTNAVVAAGSGSSSGQDGTLVFGDTSLGAERMQWLVPGYRFQFSSNAQIAGSLTLGLVGGSNVVCDVPPDAFVRLTDNLTICQGTIMNVGGGSCIQVGGAFSILGSNSVLVAQGKNTYSQVDGQWAGAGIALIASNFTVGMGASLNADGQGYAGGWVYPGSGPGSGNWWNGGSYGGHGGLYGWNGGANPTYGSGEFPVDLGSAAGGSFDSWFCSADGGGTGGGAIHLVVRDTTEIEGVMTVNGTAGWAGGAGGSGGSIWIETDALIGSGLITANGGGMGGGGGRIAVYRRLSGGFDVSRIQVMPGSADTAGELGTVVISDPVPLQVLGLSPNGVQKKAFEYMDVRFSSMVAEGALTPADLTFTTPSGKIASNQLTVVWIGGTTYRIGCPLQWGRGRYSLQVGPEVRSLFGVAMAGTYTGVFTIEWPSIAGAVCTPQGWPVGGVTVLTNGTPIVTTGTNGLYAVLVPLDWSGEVSVSLPGATFSPISRSYSDVVADVPGQTFTLASGYIPSFALLRASGGARIEWPSLSGLYYQIECSVDLTAWQDCGPALPGTGGAVGFDLDPGSAPHLFYRLRLCGP